MTKFQRMKAAIVAALYCQHRHTEAEQAEKCRSWLGLVDFTSGVAVPPDLRGRHGHVDMATACTNRCLPTEV